MSDSIQTANIASTMSFGTSITLQIDFDLYELFKQAISYENRVEKVRKEMADRPDFNPLQCLVEIHCPKNIDLCYKHFQIFFNSKGIQYMQRDLDYISQNYSDKNDYKIQSHNLNDIVVTHTDFMAQQIILGRQASTFPARGTMHFKTLDLFVDIFQKELEQFRQVEKAKMRLFSKYGLKLFDHPLFLLKPLHFNDLLAFMTEMSKREDEAKLKKKLELIAKKEQESQSHYSSKNKHNRSTSSEKKKSHNQSTDSNSLDRRFLLLLEGQKVDAESEEYKEKLIFENTETLWRRMHQNNRKKYKLKTFSRLRDYVTPLDYFENAKVHNKKLEFEQQEYFNPNFEGFRQYTTIQKRGKKVIDTYINQGDANPWKSTEQMPINIKFASNLYDQKTNQGDKFFKDFAVFHKRQLVQNQFI